jgi:cation diffusion facilitator family transporter
LILAATAALQLVVVYVSHSVALLADTIHNIADAGTAIPLWVAFVLARRKPTQTFTYGYGRVEDFAGIVIVLIILFSALVAGYQAIDRLIHPLPVLHLGWLAAAGVIGFLGNEAVAVFRIRVGRQINSAALIADGYHARTGGLTSLAVVLGAFGVWMGFPLADPIIGLIITVVILGIVWQSAKVVLTRMLDGVEPRVTSELRHSAEHAKGVLSVESVRARWLGHRLYCEMTLAVDPKLSLADARKVADDVKQHARGHMPALESLHVEVMPASGRGI